MLPVWHEICRKLVILCLFYEKMGIQHMTKIFFTMNTVFLRDKGSIAGKWIMCISKD